ncbi:class I SAM-dependent methyltransferase [Sphingosinicella sp.]|uniref:class I SAM-dependent methyltransferase n=1 Tax=Sphingosinicella sp. TaxID=1917971 RepID=UPI004037CF75
MTDDHGSVELAAPNRQAGNRRWWTENTMSYDWKEKSAFERFSLEWYDDIDRRFLHAARLFNGTPNPFVELMDLEHLKGARVLEIGCGMGFHSELLLRAGANVTSVDISPTSVSSTQKRLDLKGLKGDVRQMDAEHLDLPDAEFDLVWSWGVIHHSARTGRVLREINRVMKPDGEVRLMVYNLEGMQAYVTMMRRYMFGFWRGRSLDDQLWRDSDGFTARYYTRDSWRDLLSIFFDNIEIAFYGQDADAVPLPRRLRRPFLKIIPVRTQERLARARGLMLFSIGRKLP